MAISWSHACVGTGAGGNPPFNLTLMLLSVNFSNRAVTRTAPRPTLPLALVLGAERTGLTRGLEPTNFWSCSARTAWLPHGIALRGLTA